MRRNNEMIVLALLLLINSLLFAQTKTQDVEITKVFECLNNCGLGVGEILNLKQVDSFEIDKKNFEGLEEVNNPLGQMRLSCRDWYSDEFNKDLLLGCGYAVYSYKTDMNGAIKEGKLYTVEGNNEAVYRKLLEQFSKRIICLKGEFKTRKVYCLVNAGANKLIFVELDRDIFERKWILEKERCLLK